MTNKDDEQILVVKSDIIFEKGKWQGLKTDNLNYYLDLIKNNCEFRRRGDVENDDSFQQIIPYVVFNYQNKYFIYKYLSQAGEQRLIDTYQLGVGGHINHFDAENGNILESGTMREWNEEVNFKGNIIGKKLVGILNDDSKPVERVHLGLVYNFIGDSSDISIKETDKMDGKLVDLMDVEEYIKDNNGVWVKIVYNEYLKKLKNNMDNFLKNYQEFCKTTSAKYENPEKEIMTWGLGVAGEAGDVAGCIKKTFSHGNDQKEGIKENLGDTMWYIAMICNFFGWNLEDVVNGNMAKLQKRYPQGFTEQDASRNNTRIDWNEEPPKPANKIVCIVGMTGSGKSEVSDELVRRGFSYLRFGQIVLDKIKERGLEVNETNEREIREGLRKDYGMAAFAILNIPKLDDLVSRSNVVVDGLYSWSEYKVLKEKYGNSINIIAVSAPPQIRYQRLAERKLDDSDKARRFRPLTEQQAKKRDYSEIENIEKGGPIAMADFTILNTGTMEELKDKIDKILL